jgi:glycine/D-amino acid oxidase-like deaminating enzyme
MRITLSDGHELSASYVFNCTYSQTNQLLARSGLPRLPLKHELAELALIEVPEVLKGIGFTIMDGPFFSTMPFPSLEVHTLSHVRYTPHYSWTDSLEREGVHTRKKETSTGVLMLKDAQRYVPALREARLLGSLFETKTVLLQNEVDDGRPILCRSNHGIKNLFVVLGAKVDNIYDIVEAVERESFASRPVYASC